MRGSGSKTTIHSVTKVRVRARDSIHRNRKGSHKWLFHVSSPTYSVKEKMG